MTTKSFFVLIFIFCSKIVVSQNPEKVNPVLLNEKWDARWIKHPETPTNGEGVYLFRKVFDLEGISDHFIVNVSADARYKLYVNGKYVCNGPATGDLLKWRFETLDIAKYLTSGTNTIAAIVWNLGNLNNPPQISAKTGFILQGNSEVENVLNTNNSWKVHKDTSINAFFIDDVLPSWVAVPGEKFKVANHPWNWKEINFSDSDWKSAKAMENGRTMQSLSYYGIFPTHSLHPREIPSMEINRQNFKAIRKTEGISNSSNLIVSGKPLIVPANTNIKILLDQGELTNAYPVIEFSKGKESEIQLKYAESLFIIESKDGKEVVTRKKGNRDNIEGKKLKGNSDIIICDGSDNRVYEPLVFRTFRYVELSVETKDEPLEINELYSLFTGYPLKEKSEFLSNSDFLSDVWKTGWHTQRLCAMETFFDCPYYEQLQYVGDTRIQALLTFYVSGDTLLWRKAIADFYDSRLPFGLTQSRYPSRDAQLIPTFSLVWITMLHDYLMHCRDDQFVKSMLPAVLDILQWFEKRLEPNGMPGYIEGWNFVDWADNPGWKQGIPPMDNNKHSAIIGLQYAYTIDKAVELLSYFDIDNLSNQYKQLAAKIKNGIYETCWDENKNLISDTPEKKYFSHHANIFAVLNNTIPLENQKEVVELILNNKDIAQSTYYFRFYLAEAIRKVGLGNEYVQTLEPWKIMLDNGLTTFAERPEPSRSDCHAWSSSPLYHFLSLICGIRPASPGFKKVEIAPNPGDLTWIKGKMHHLNGDIIVDLRQGENQSLSGKVVLPPGLSGSFIWKNNLLNLEEGTTEINF